MVLALVSAAHAECNTALLDARLEEAERALGNVDLPAFRAAAEGATATVACLEQALTPAAAARVHRVVGLQAFFDKDADAAAAAFAAARAADPSSTIPESWLPAGHPARKAWIHLDPVPSASERLEPPLDGDLLFDGLETLARPSLRPTIAQWRTDDEVKASVYLWPGSAMLSYDVAGPVVISKRAPRDGPSVPLLVASGALLAGAGVSYALAADAHQRWEDPSTATSELDDLRELNNGLFVTSVLAGAMGAGSAVTAFVVGSF